MFLTLDELRDLTGYALPAYQCRWLDRRGYPFETTGNGRPKVLRGYVEKRLGLLTAVTLDETEPDFSRWKK